MAFAFTHGLYGWGALIMRAKIHQIIAVDDTEEHDDRNVQLETVEDKIDSFCRKKEVAAFAV